MYGINDTAKCFLTSSVFICSVFAVGCSILPAAFKLTLNSCVWRCKARLEMLWKLKT